jgi:uncharacterized protein (DUF983 family)
MTVKFEYVADCCGHKYAEQRAKDEPMFFPICNICKSGNYVLVTETVISEEIERQAAPVAEPVVEEDPAL